MLTFIFTKNVTVFFCAKKGTKAEKKVSEFYYFKN
ncbi:hypothetical protein J2Y02_001407 [Neobacillus drentensis]|nr:hypothetical protein [Neobacillus drentensis]